MVSRFFNSLSDDVEQEVPSGSQRRAGGHRNMLFLLL